MPTNSGCLNTSPSVHSVILVGLAFLCVLAAAVIALFEPRMEETAAAYWIPLQRRLAYQGFVLLPIPGIGPFILPRFFGLPSPHDFPEACMGLTSGSTNPRLPVFLVTD